MLWLSGMGFGVLAAFWVWGDGRDSGLGAVAVTLGVRRAKRTYMDGETVFAVLLGAALAVFSLVMAGYPVLRDAFFRPAQRGDDDAALAEPGDDDGGQSTYGGLNAPMDGVGLESIYDSIDTLELEYQLGNLPEAEYRRQLQAYRLEAAAVIKAQMERGDDGAEDGLRYGGLNAPDPASGAIAACPQCDAPMPAGHRGACPGCGVAAGGDVGDGNDGGNVGDGGGRDDGGGARRS